MKHISIFCLVLAAGLMLAGCNELKSRDQLNQGIQSFRSAKYQDATDHFKRAIELDPTNNSARLYLATAYMQQWIPGAVSPENSQMADAARDEFMKVLAQDPNDKTALSSLASLNYNEAQSLSGDQKIQKFDEAATWYKKLIQVEPSNKEAYYSLGVIAWAKWYPALMTARTDLGIKPEDESGPIQDKKVKAELEQQYGQIVQQGLDDLGKALKIDPQYDDAMLYMNLLVRERANLADSQQQFNQEIETANNWQQKALDVRKEKAEKQPGATGITTGK